MPDKSIPNSIPNKKNDWVGGLGPRALLPRKNFLLNSSKCRVNIKKMMNRNNRCCDFGTKPSIFAK